MKRYFLAIVLTLLIAVTANSATSRKYYGPYRQGNTGYLLGGEHTCIIYSDSGYCCSAVGAHNPYTTDWMQISVDNTLADSGVGKGNQLIQDANPQYFTLSVLKALYGAGDSALITSARFELADSSSAKWPMWNSDSSNLFIASGNYSRPDYGIWTAEPSTTAALVTRWTKYPLRVFDGMYIRFTFTTTTSDTCTIKWRFKCEH